MSASKSSQSIPLDYVVGISKELFVNATVYWKCWTPALFRVDLSIFQGHKGTVKP